MSDQPELINAQPDAVDAKTAVWSLAELARDPVLIAGIHEACDQWCMYCPATSRCLAVRASSAVEVGAVVTAPGAGQEQVAEGMLLQKMLADAEGRLAPPDVEAALSGDRERMHAVFTLDDPLERLGRRYVTVATAYLGSRADFPPDCAWRREGPTALEVLTWHHVLVPARVFRAVLADIEARGGVRGRRTDTLRAAKMALVGIDRSTIAIEHLMTTDEDPRLELLHGLARQLREAVESRFPGAGQYIRPGLDRDTRADRPLPRGLRRLRRLLHWPEGGEVDATSRDRRGPASDK